MHKCNTKLIPQLHVGLLVILLALLSIQAPEAESVHDLPQCVVVVEELNGAHDVEVDLRVRTHVEGMDGTWGFGDIVAWLANPFVPRKQTISKPINVEVKKEKKHTRDNPSCP